MTSLKKNDVIFGQKFILQMASILMSVCLEDPFKGHFTPPINSLYLNV